MQFKYKQLRSKLIKKRFNDDYHPQKKKTKFRHKYTENYQNSRQMPRGDQRLAKDLQ